MSAWSDVIFKILDSRFKFNTQDSFLNITCFGCLVGQIGLARPGLGTFFVGYS